jgi:type IV secretory pathway VirB2 component (pilin)
MHYQNPSIAASRMAFAALAAFAVLLFSSTNAYAGFNLCPVVESLFYGGLAPGIATLGIIGIGVSATFGKITWGMAVIVGVGIAAIFGAGTLVADFSNGINGCTAS